MISGCNEIRGNLSLVNLIVSEAVNNWICVNLSNREKRIEMWPRICYPVIVTTLLFMVSCKQRWLAHGWFQNDCRLPLVTGACRVVYNHFIEYYYLLNAKITNIYICRISLPLNMHMTVETIDGTYMYLNIAHMPIVTEYDCKLRPLSSLVLMKSISNEGHNGAPYRPLPYGYRMYCNLPLHYTVTYFTANIIEINVCSHSRTCFSFYVNHCLY